MLKFKLLLLEQSYTTNRKTRKTMWVCIVSDTLCNAANKAKELYPDYGMSMGSPLLKTDYVLDRIKYT
jgi:hypothetical protein